MSDLRNNSILGALLASVLGVMGVGVLAEGVIHPNYPETPGYLPEVSLETGGGPAGPAGPPDFGRLFADEAQLTATEFDLLVALAARPEVVRTREQLLAEVWGYRDGSGLRTVDSHIRALRRKLGDGWIRTVHGVGYALEVPQ